MLAGLLLVAAALFLTAKNLQEQKQAENAAQAVLGQLSAQIPSQVPSEETLAVAGASGEEIAWPMDAQGNPMPWPLGEDGKPCPVVEDASGVQFAWPQQETVDGRWHADASGAILPWVADGNGNLLPWPLDVGGSALSWAEISNDWSGIVQSLAPYAAEQPIFVRNPDMEMPVEKIDGNYYIGILEIPSQELSLPVMSEWSYPNLRTAPCRYSGSVYSGDLVIAGHNYARHFGVLKNLAENEDICFTDTQGNVFYYRVCQSETLEETDVERMQAGEWDLTLFTCTYGGEKRVAVRCELLGYDAAP